MTGPRTAELTIRGPRGPMRCSVSWPALAGPGVATPLVYFPAGWVDATPIDLARDALWRELRCAAGLVALGMRSRESRGDESAVLDAATAVEWVADHAPELAADRCRVLVAGDGASADVVDAVVRRARERGWPPVFRHQPANRR